MGETTVGTWNLQNYLSQNRWVHGAYRFEYPKPAAEKEAISRLLVEQSTDVLFLQELGGRAYLEELRTDLRKRGLDYPYGEIVQVGGQPRALGVLSKVPMKSVVGIYAPSMDEQGQLPRRGFMEVRMEIEGDIWRLFHVHLKSRFSRDPEDPDSDKYREKELSVIMSWIAQMEKAHPGERMLILGDFNTPFENLSLSQLNKNDNWLPIQAEDMQGETWTYYSKKHDSKERVDGFWIRKRDLPLIGRAKVVNVTNGQKASDHRLIVTTILKKKSVTPSSP